MRMIRWFLLGGLLFATSSVFAGVWPEFYVDHVLVREGETQTIQVFARASGFNPIDPGPFVPPWIFQSTNAKVALVDGLLDFPGALRDIKITGVTVGVAGVWLEVDGWGREYVTITVTPRPVRVTIAPSALKTTVGRPITLLAQSESSPIVFHWYAGPLGNTSQPLPADGNEWTFTPSAPGRYLFWVSAVGEHGMNNDEVTIDVDPAPRRRAVRR